MKDDIAIFEHAYCSNTIFRTTLTPGKHVTIERIDSCNLVGIRRFVIGDRAEYDSGYIHYIGTISSITTKNIVINDQWKEKKWHLNPYTFSWRNWDFVEEYVNQRNAEISMHI